MTSDALVRLFGFGVTLIHGDLLVLDRWRWLKRRLPRTANGERLLEVGCGSGAFTIGAATRGYTAMGLSWDEHNQSVASSRAQICGVDAQFPIIDARKLAEQIHLTARFDVVICFENIEHIIDDLKLMRDMANCLKPGGRIILTTPNIYYHEITKADLGPFREREDGGHVRRGYSRQMLNELCLRTGLVMEEIGSCGGFFSQKITGLQRATSSLRIVSWVLTLPLRLMPIWFDELVRTIFGWPDYSICMVAYKARFD